MLRTQGGFCNRFRAIVSAVLWAEDLDRNLAIYWPIEMGHMPCGLGDLLVPESIPRLSSVHNGYLSKAHQVLSSEDMKTVVEVFDEIRIESYSEFHPDLRHERGLKILRNIRIQPDLEAAAAAEWVKLGAPVGILGVHFRGTDHRKCLAKSPLASFVKTVGDKHIFLVTDEPGVKRVFNALTVNLPLGRRTPEEQKCGVIEWLLLQKCGSILGSDGSSYSELASLRGNIPYERVRISID